MRLRRLPKLDMSSLAAGPVAIIDGQPCRLVQVDAHFGSGVFDLVFMTEAEFNRRYRLDGPDGPVR